MIPDIGLIIGVYVIIRLLQMGSVSHFTKQNGDLVHKPGIVIPILCIFGIIIVVASLWHMFDLSTQATKELNAVPGLIERYD